MALWDNIRLSFASLWAGKLRALLTMLGIIIGIGAVIAIVTVGNSLTGSITSSLSGFGINNITVSLEQKDEDSGYSVISMGRGAAMISGGGGLMFGPSAPSEEDLLTDGMIAEYKEAFGDRVAGVACTQSVGSGTVTQGETSVTVSASGVNADYTAVNDVEMLAGRFILDTDGDRALAVVSDLFCESVFGAADDSVLGQSFTITLNGVTQRFYVAGVYEYGEDAVASLTGSDPVTDLYMPLGLARRLAGADEGYQQFTVAAADGTDTRTLMEQTEEFFASYYTRNESYTVGASSMESMLEEMTGMLGTVTLAISAIAAISLLVGGIGVMNIMLVSITERTREIGTRKALGARSSAIRLQFVTEAVVICLVGGVLGVALGIGLGAAGANLLGYAARPTVSSILLAVGFSMAIGVFFGYYPAGKAAKMDPIEALRYE